VGERAVCGLCKHWANGYCELRKQAVAASAAFAERCNFFEPGRSGEGKVPRQEAALVELPPIAEKVKTAEEGPRPEVAAATAQTAPAQAQVPAQARQAEATQARETQPAQGPQPVPKQAQEVVPQPELGEKAAYEWRRGSIRVRLHLGKSEGYLIIEKDRAVELEEDFERQHTQRVIQRAGIVLGDLAAEGLLSEEGAAELKREIEERVTEWAKRQLVIETPSGTITLEVLTWSEEDWENWRRFEDFYTQYELLRIYLKREGRGVLEGSFWLWAASRELLPMEGKEGGGWESLEKAWKRLNSAEKAKLLFRHLEEKGVVHAFSVATEKGKEYYITLGYNNILLELESWGRDVLSLLYFGLLSEHVRRELLSLLRAAAKPIPPERVNPPHMLRLRDAVLDLENLRVVSLEEVEDYYFTYVIPLFTSRPLGLRGTTIRSIIESVKSGAGIEHNKVYQLFRPRFEDRDWEYLIDALGTILSPHRFKLLVFLIGETGSGKSTLLSIITKPIEPLVARPMLNMVLNYTFGMESFVGKQVWVSMETGETVLRKVSLLNYIFGESDKFEAPRKFRRAETVRSLKVGIFAMNDPPLITEYGGETMRALVERLSVIYMHRPEGAENIPFLSEQVSIEDAFEFLVWCRWQLEQRGWKVRKRGEEEILQELRRQTNTALQFIEWGLATGKLEEGPEKKIKGEELYSMYDAWCYEKGITPMNRTKFYSVVSKLFEKIPPEKTKDKTVWFRGIGKKEEAPARQQALELQRFEEF
jgi:energy-coupling factor transporter ATP-binding protein EcfA2